MGLFGTGSVSQSVLCHWCFTTACPAVAAQSCKQSLPRATASITSKGRLLCSMTIIVAAGMGRGREGGGGVGAPTLCVGGTKASYGNVGHGLLGLRDWGSQD